MAYLLFKSISIHSDLGERICLFDKILCMMKKGLTIFLEISKSLLYITL